MPCDRRRRGWGRRRWPGEWGKPHRLEGSLDVLRDETLQPVGVQMGGWHYRPVIMVT